MTMYFLESIKLSAEIQKDRPLDISFLIDALAKMNEGADSRFTGRVDTDAVGVVGMSFGGWTAAKVAETDSRVKGAVCHCPSFVRGVDTPKTPIMILTGREDTVIGAEGNRMCVDYFENSTVTGSYLIDIKAAGHVRFGWL